MAGVAFVSRLTAVARAPILPVVGSNPANIAIPARLVVAWRRTAIYYSELSFEPHYLPMLRHIAEPVDAARLVAPVRPVFHAAISPSKDRISPSSFLMSASISGSGRGGS